MAESKYKLNIPLFDGEVEESKYMLWKSRVRDHLEEFGGNVYMTKELHENASEAERIISIRARNFIKAHLHVNLLMKYDGFSAYQIMKDLDTNHDNKTRRCQFRLRTQLINKKFTGEGKLTVFITQLEMLFSEYMTAGGNVDELEKAAYLLEAMPAKFKNVCDLIKTLPDDNVNYTFIKTKLIEFDKEKETENLANKVLLARNDNRPNKRNEYNVKYNNHKFNKTPRRINNNLRNDRATCYTCGKRGHTQRQCWHNSSNNRKPVRHQVNYAEVSEDPIVL